MAWPITAMLVAGTLLWLRHGDVAVSVGPSPLTGAAAAAARDDVHRGAVSAIASPGPQDANAAASRAAGGQRPAYVLPAADAPLRDILAELQREAAAGNGQAACRLGAELMRCQRARRANLYPHDAVALARAWASQRLDDQEVERRTTVALQQQTLAARELERCAGVDFAALPPAARYFMQAADRGHVRSMLQVLSPLHYDTAALFRDPELIPMYRVRLPRFLAAVLEAGDPDVVPLLVVASLDPDGVLAAALPPAWRERGFAFALQDRLALARTPAGIEMPPPSTLQPGLTITAAQRAAAERAFDRYFAGKDLRPQPRPPTPRPPGAQEYHCHEAMP